jgi:hypothetical protein
MAKEDKRRETGGGARPQRNEKGGAGNGRMAEYSLEDERFVGSSNGQV